MLRARIAGTGIYEPPRVQTAADLAPQLGVSERWITRRTGVRERRISEIPMHEMGAIAAREALGDGPPPDLLVNASVTALQLIPDSSVFLQQALGLSGIPSYTVHGTCLSFLAAFHHVAALVDTGAYRRALIVSSEQVSKGRNFEEPESASLIGDGAAAAVIEPTPPSEESGVLSFCMRTYPEGADLTEVRAGGTLKHPRDPSTTDADCLFHMAGPESYLMAMRKGPPVVAEALEKAGCEIDDIALFVPHQASGPGLAAFERAGAPAERIVDIVGRFGNCGAASLPMALAVAERDGRLKRGERIALVGTGAGISVAAAIVVW